MCRSVEYRDKLRFHHLFPILPTVVILYLVPRFSLCGSVEDRDKLAFPQPLNSRSFFSFTLLNWEIVASAELRRCVLMPSGNNRFVGDKFSELVDTEIAHPNRSQYSCVITLPVTASSRQNAQQSKISGNSWELFNNKSKIIFAIALHFLTNIKYSQYILTRLSVGIQWLLGI